MTRPVGGHDNRSMNRSAFINALGVLSMTSTADLTFDSGDTTVAGVVIPDTPLARDAGTIARNAEGDELFNHSLRTFFFAELIAQARCVPHDSEVVYVASIMHDLGLTARYMSANNRFEVDGANAARDLMQQHGLKDAAIDAVWDAIALHDNGGIARWKRPEVALVNAGVAADFGAQLEILTPNDIRDVLQRAPRDGFIEAFLPAVATVAAKKPNATGTCFVTDVGYRMVPHFHPANFCDEVKSNNPFAQYH